MRPATKPTKPTQTEKINRLAEFLQENLSSAKTTKNKEIAFEAIEYIKTLNPASLPENVYGRAIHLSHFKHMPTLAKKVSIAFYIPIAKYLVTSKYFDINITETPNPAPPQKSTLLLQ
jgi:hypothetical protein